MTTPSPSPETPSEQPGTGSEDSLVLFGTTAAIAFMALAGLYFYRRNQNQKS